jgi:hypothetical protein
MDSFGKCSELIGDASLYSSGSVGFRRLDPLEVSTRMLEPALPLSGAAGYLLGHFWPVPFCGSHF